MRERRVETRLVGRNTDLERLLAHSSDPTTGAVLLTGPTGVGKSRLAEGLLSELGRRGWRGIGLSATNPASDIPFAALSEIIPDTLDGLRGLDARDADLAVLRAVEDALELGATDHRAVVIIDEVASFDEPAANVLVHLAKNRRLLVVATQASGPEVSVALSRLTPAGVVEVAVAPLDLPGTADLASELLGGPVDPGLVREVWVRSQGWPLYVKELIATGCSTRAIRGQARVHQLSGPLTVSSSTGRQILHRLGVLNEGERMVLELLALAGELDVDDLAGVVDEQALDELDRRDIIVTSTVAGRIAAALAHPLVGEAVLADMTALALRRRHRQLADLLDRRPDHLPSDAVLLALARLGGGESVGAGDLVDAAVAALRADRIHDASKLAEAAFAARADERTRTVLAEALIRQGRFIEADALLADPISPDAGEWERMRRAIRRSSNQLWGFRDADAARRIDEVCRPTLSDPDAVARLVAHEAWIAYCDGAPGDAIALTDPLTDNDHPDVRFAVAAARAPALVLGGRVEEGAALAQRAWDGEWGADTEYGSHGQHLIALGFGQLYLGELELARLIAAEAMRVCKERSETLPLLFFLDLAAWSELLAGDMRAASSFFEEARRIGTDLALTTPIRASLSGAVVADAQLGDPEATSKLWQRVRDVPVAPGPRADFEVGVAEAWTVAATGDPAKAAELLRSIADECERRGIPVLQVLALVDVVRLGYASPVDADRAAEAADRCQGPLMRLLASVVEAASAADGRRLEDVAGELGDRGFVLWAAEFAACAADCLSKSGDQRAAASAQRLSDRYRRQIPAVRTPLLARTLGVEPLTRRERDIATRVSTGATNAEIAEQLHVSVRTVETHLQRVYRKLGITSRRELADVLEP